jgi:hypothetical protein
MKIGSILLLFCSLNVVVFAQTGPEKVAAAYCECSKTIDISPYVAIFKKGDKKVIHDNYDAIIEVRGNLKRCAKEHAVLTPEENRKVDEQEIRAAMSKNCPDVQYFLEQFQKMLAEED